MYGFMTYLDVSEVDPDRRFVTIHRTITQSWKTPLGTLTSVREMAADGSFVNTKLWWKALRTWTYWSTL